MNTIKQYFIDNAYKFVKIKFNKLIDNVESHTLVGVIMPQTVFWTNNPVYKDMYTIGWPYDINNKNTFNKSIVIDTNVDNIITVLEQPTNEEYQTWLNNYNKCYEKEDDQRKDMFFIDINNIKFN